MWLNIGRIAGSNWYVLAIQPRKYGDNTLKIVNCTGLSLAMILLASTEVALSQPLIEPIGARAVSCPGQGWTQYPMPPQVSRENLFCGEIKNGGKGFHSRPGGQNPATVTEFKVTQPANAAGIYGAQVTLSING